MLKKIFWSCTVLALAGAGLIYVVSHHQGSDPVEYTKATLQGYVDAVKQQARPMNWRSFRHEMAQVDLEQELTPQPAKESDLILPQDVIAQAPEDLPVHIDIENQAIPVLPHPVQAVPTKRTNRKTPLVMPYCEDPKPSRRMPYADEHRSTTGAGGEETSEQPFEIPNCEIDPHHHQHYPCCPYTGKSMPPASSEPLQPANGLDLENKLQSIKKKHESLQLEQELLPKRLDIDTMEARPADISWWPSLQLDL